MTAQEWGISNVYVYRAGIVEWVKEYPDQSIVEGKTLVGASDDYFLDQEKYQQHCLTPEAFVAASREPRAVVFDIRDVAAGRADFPVALPNAKHYPVDRLVKLITSKSRKITRKKVLILDSCGTQAQWLQYALEDAGVKDYFFLEGGMLNWRHMALGSVDPQQVQ